MDFSKVIKIIPTYNEKENVALMVSAIHDLHPTSSILFVDDHSPDGTADHVRQLQSTSPNVYLLERFSDRGLGRSYVDGLRKVMADGRYDAVVMMDADFSHDPAAIQHMVAELKDHPVVVGSRYIPGGDIKNWDWRRRLLSRFANIYVTAILGSPVKDMTAGFACFRTSIIPQIGLNSLTSDGYAFAVEWKYRLLKAGIPIYEYPITFTERRQGQSKMSGKIIWESIWLPWKLRFSK